MSTPDKNYELEMLKMMVNKYLDKSILLTNKTINESEANRDQLVWDIATKIYQQSGHKVELSLVRDIVNSRISTIKHQLAKEASYIAAQKSQKSLEAVRHIADAEKALYSIELYSIESDPQFFSKVTAVVGKFGGDERKAKVFVGVRKIISEKLSVEESEVTLDSHLSNHLNADDVDLIELLIALEETFGIEIPDEVSAKYLDITISCGGSFWWGSSSPSPTSFTYNAGEKCIVRNFVELIYEKGT